MTSLHRAAAVIAQWAYDTLHSNASSSADEQAAWGSPQVRASYDVTRTNDAFLEQLCEHGTGMYCVTCVLSTDLQRDSSVKPVVNSAASVPLH